MGRGGTYFVVLRLAIGAAPGYDRGKVKRTDGKGKGRTMASFTKNAIKASFLKLLDQRPLNQITVKDIVEDCGVNRNSFYYHFADIPALLEEIITERAGQIIEEYGGADSLEDCLRAAAQFASQNRRAVLHAYRSVSRDVVEEYLMRICRRTVEAYARAAIGENPVGEEDREVLIRFFQCECFGQAILWLNSGLSDDIDTQFIRLCQLMHGMTEELIRRCAEGAKSGN